MFPCLYFRNSTMWHHTGVMTECTTWQLPFLRNPEQVSSLWTASLSEKNQKSKSNRGPDAASLRFAVKTEAVSGCGAWAILSPPEEMLEQLGVCSWGLVEEADLEAQSLSSLNRFSVLCEVSWHCPLALFKRGGHCHNPHSLLNHKWVAQATLVS